MREPAIGLDFGTTNSSLAISREGGRPQLARFPSPDGRSEIFRSLLYFEEGERGGQPRVLAGPAAIAGYLASEEKTGRLMQSLKSFLASRLFSSTSVFGRSYRLEELIALLLGPLREEAERDLGTRIRRVVAGRPVHFVQAEGPEDDEFALARLRAALHNAGFEDVTFEYEPVGAAYHYERELERDELILIADFGGGTSDFSLLRVGPSFRHDEGRRDSILGHDGVGLAGDAFDGKLVRHLVAPRLGRGTEFRSSLGDPLPVPGWIYRHLERWHHLSFLRSPRTLGLLLDLRREALAPRGLDALVHVVEHDLGFPLHRATEETKRALSVGSRARLRLAHEDLEIEGAVARDRFEAWIAEEVQAIGACVDRLLARTGVAPGQVDRVFLTGGSSLVPAVRGLFLGRFGAERLRGGAELTSVASGLALRAGRGGAPA